MPLQGLIPLIAIVGDLITRKHVKHALHVLDFMVATNELNDQFSMLIM
jgi:hypothetical protein